MQRRPFWKTLAVFQWERHQRKQHSSARLKPHSFPLCLFQCCCCRHLHCGKNRRLTHFTGPLCGLRWCQSYWSISYWDSLGCTSTICHGEQTSTQQGQRGAGTRPVWFTQYHNHFLGQLTCCESLHVTLATKYIRYSICDHLPEYIVLHWHCECVGPCASYTPVLEVIDQNTDQAIRLSLHRQPNSDLSFSH